MSEREQKPKEDEQAEREETVEDIEVPEGDAEDVEGGKQGWPSSIEWG